MLKRSRTYVPGGSFKRPFKKPKYTVATAKKTSLGASNKLLRSKQQVVLRYHEDFSINGGSSGLPDYYTFSATSLRDPNVSGIGHQPRGFDQLMSLFTHYIVDEVLIEVFYQSNLTRECVSFIQVRDAPPTLMSRNDAFECQTMTEGYIGSTNAGYGGKLQMTVKPNEFLGLKKHDDGMKGSTLANPPADVYLTVGLMSIDPGVDIAPTNVVVKLTYKVTLIEPKEPGAS